MKFDYRKYLNLKKLTKVWGFIKRYQFIIGTVIVLILFFFIVSRINSLAGVEKDQDRYDLGILELDRITFDQEAIDAIKDLQDRNVEVELSLPNNRDNPF